MLRTVWVDDVDAVPVELWERFFAAEDEGAWLYRVLERSGLEDQFRFRYLLLREGEQWVGIAPTFLMDVPLQLVAPAYYRRVIESAGKWIPWLRAQRTLFVGSPLAEEGRVGLDPHVDRGAALRCIEVALQQEMRARGATLRVWKDFPAVDEGIAQAMALEPQLFPMVSFPGTVVDLPSGTKDGYLESLRNTQRQRFKRKIRRSRERVSLRVELVRRPDATTLTSLYSLFCQTYEKSKTRFERLGLRFFEQIAAEPVAAFLVLRETAGGDPVAFMLCLEVQGKMINKFIGIDYSRPRDWLLYFRLWDAAVDHALATGATAIQSGQTGYGPKLDLGHRLLPLTNYVAHRNPLVHRVYRAVAGQIDWQSLDAALAAALKAHPELRRPSSVRL